MDRRGENLRASATINKRTTDIKQDYFSSCNRAYLASCLRHRGQLLIWGEQMISQKKIDEIKSKIIPMLKHYEVKKAAIFG